MPAFYNNLIQLPQDREKLNLSIGVIGEYKFPNWDILYYACYSKVGLYRVYYGGILVDNWAVAEGLKFNEAKSLFEALKWLNLSFDDIPKKLTPLVKQSRLKKNQDAVSKKDGLFWFFVDGLTSQLGL